MLGHEPYDPRHPSVPSYGDRPNDPESVLNYFAASFTEEFRKANEDNNSGRFVGVL